MGGKVTEWMKDNLTGREMRIAIREEYFNWRREESRVPQGSFLAPIMFTIYIMPKGTKI